LEGVDLLALSPGVPLAEPLPRLAMARGVEIVGDIELLARALPHRSKVLAVTGTNGKTTVTALAGEMVKAAGHDAEVAGNIGPAALDALMAREDSQTLPEIWVLELSSFQLETTVSLDPAAAAVLNVTEDHLDRYASMDAYAAAKARVFAGSGVQILNRDDAYSLRMALPGRRQITFGLDAPREPEHFGLLKIAGEYWLAQGMTPLARVSDMQLAGLHNAANALAALALCRALGCSYTPLLAALARFKPLQHRLERVGERDGVAFYDDSKGTNVGATVAALGGFASQLARSGGRVVLIAGGEGKQQNFAPLKEAVARAARAVVLIGRDAPALEQVLRDSGALLARASSMQAAVEEAFAQARPGDVVLLSPACASFDMFRNYQHRGEEFRAAVQRLATHAPH
jgi:UDP-N-acetylmuramoylalanine--D-glutamate ligase